MKMILTWLLFLAGTPLVAYATCRLYFMLFAWGLSPWFVTGPLVFILVCLGIIYILHGIFAAVIIRREVKKAEHMTPEEKLEKLKEIVEIEEITTPITTPKIWSSFRKENYPYIARCATYVWLFVVYLVSGFAHSQLNSAELYGKVICTSERIFSTSGEVLATPQEHSKPQLIKRDGSMYILYGDEKKSFSIYDLDGKLVECRDKNDREYY